MVKNQFKALQTNAIFTLTVIPHEALCVFEVCQMS